MQVISSHGTRYKMQNSLFGNETFNIDEHASL